MDVVIGLVGDASYSFSYPVRPYLGYPVLPYLLAWSTMHLSCGLCPLPGPLLPIPCIKRWLMTPRAKVGNRDVIDGFGEYDTEGLIFQIEPRFGVSYCYYEGFRACGDVRDRVSSSEVQK